MIINKYIKSKMFNNSLCNSYPSSECSTSNITLNKTTTYKYSLHKTPILLKSKLLRNPSDTHDQNTYNDFSDEDSTSNYSKREGSIGNANDISFESKEPENNVNVLINGLMNVSYIPFQISDKYKK